MLEVLGRSGTGQKLTVYTNILTGPRRPGEADGPEELHVVLVDNGRSEVLASELAEILYCIRCGACLYACPVYQQIGGHAYGSVYSGPVGSVLSPALAGIHAFHELPHASTLCGACKEVCPVRIDIPRMLLRLRAKGVEAGESPQWVSLGIKVLGWIGTKPRLFGLAGRVAARVAGMAATGRLDPRAAAPPRRVDRVARLPRPGQGVVPGALGEAARIVRADAEPVVTPANRARMREVTGRAVRTGLFSARGRGAARAHGRRARRRRRRRHAADGGDPGHGVGRAADGRAAAARALPRRARGARRRRPRGIVDRSGGRRRRGDRRHGWARRRS